MLHIVQAVDREAGTITTRPATRWERLRWRLSPRRLWLRAKDYGLWSTLSELWPWRRKSTRRVTTAVAGTVTLADKNDVWHFRTDDKIVRNDAGAP